VDKGPYNFRVSATRKKKGQQSRNAQWSAVFDLFTPVGLFRRRGFDIDSKKNAGGLGKGEREFRRGTPETKKVSPEERESSEGCENIQGFPLNEYDFRKPCPPPGAVLVYSGGGGIMKDLVGAKFSRKKKTGE